MTGAKAACGFEVIYGDGRPSRLVILSPISPLSFP